MNTTFLTISLDNIKADTYKPELDSAQLRQVVQRTYPSVTPKDGGLFSKADFNLSEQTFEENRVTWIHVPKGTTEEQMQNVLAKYPDARIQKTLSSQVVLDQIDLNNLDNLMTKELDQIKQFGSNILNINISEFNDSHRAEAVQAYKEMRKKQQLVINPTTGEVILFAGKPQYRKLEFSKLPVDDIDTRERIYSTEDNLPRVKLNNIEETVKTKQTVTA